MASDATARVSRRVLLATIVTALLCALVPTSAAAHAVLLRSSPPWRQTLAQPPEQVALLFSEPIDPLFSSVKVLDASGRAVDRGDAHVDRNDDHQLVVSLEPSLPNGVYSVLWRSLSTIDVHPDQGRYSLFVGVPVSAEPALATTTAAFSATPETTFGRWWFYIAASLFGGLLASWKLVFSRLLIGEYAAVRASMRRRTQRLIVLGGCLLVLGTLFSALAQAAAAADVPLGSAFGQPLSDLLLRGRFASVWWPRLGLEVASLLLIALGGLEGIAAESALATLPAVLLTSSLTSHGATLRTLTVAGIAIDWLHIVGATAWVGGLIGIALVLPIARGSAGSGLIEQLLARFGRFALVASLLIVVSGTVQAVLEVGSWAGLIETLYGQLILLKVGLLAAMLILAVVNARRGAFGLGVRAELMLGVLVLAVAAVLSGTPPNRV